MPVRLYLAGPMSGLPDLNFPAFKAAAANLRDRGFIVVSPAELNPDPATSWRDAMRVDIKVLVDCDGIALLPDHENSRGATLERTIAIGLGLRVHTVAELLAAELAGA